MNKYNNIMSNPYYKELDEGVLLRIDRLLNSIEADEQVFETVIDSDDRKSGIQFDYNAKQIDELRDTLQSMLETRGTYISELEEIIKSNNLMTRVVENEALVRYSRSRVLLVKHKNAVRYLDIVKKQDLRKDSVISQTKTVLWIMKVLYSKKEFDKAVNEIPELGEFVKTHDVNNKLSDKDLKEMTKIIARYKIHLVSDKEKEAYDKAKDMSDTSMSNLPEKIVNKLKENIRELQKLTREFRSVNLNQLDKSSYTSLMGNLNRRRMIYNSVVNAINDFQKKSNEMLYIVPPDVTGALIRLRPLMEEDHTRFREWAKVSVKGILTMKAVDDSLKWSLHSVRYLDDDLSYIQEQMKAIS